jgi:hypothetical protein
MLLNVLRHNELFAFLTRGSVSLFSGGDATHGGLAGFR